MTQYYIEEFQSIWRSWLFNEFDIKREDLGRTEIFPRNVSLKIPYAFLQKFTELSDPQVKTLLEETKDLNALSHQILNRHFPLYLVMRIMMKYENSPWPFPLQDKTIPQNHASKTVLGHSFWSAYAICDWIQAKLPILQDPQLNLREIIYAAFFHDIGKSQSCAWTCTNGVGRKNHCFLDVYSKINYEGESDRVHPTFSAKIIMGELPLWLKCPSRKSMANLIQLTDLEKIVWLQKWKSRHPYWAFYFNRLHFETLGLNQKNIALAALMHWEVGVINQAITSSANPEIAEVQIQQAYNNYLTIFLRSCNQLKIRPSMQQLKQCILVGFADVKGASPPELCSPNCTKICIPREPMHDLLYLICQWIPDKSYLNPYYVPKNPWTSFRLHQNYEKIFYTLVAKAVNSNLFD